MSAVPEKTLAPAARGFEHYAGTVLKGGFAVACVFYAVLAFDYFLGFGAGREGLWMRLFAALVSREHAFGQGSVHVEQAMAYREGLQFLLMHTVMGAVAMALGPLQFSNRLRRRYPAVHRTAGKTYLIGAVLSMFGGLAYLATTPMTAVFSGPMFYVALLGLDVMVLWTAWLAFAAARRRAFGTHRSWMAFNFGLLLGTPVLRLLWIAFGWMFPGEVQAVTNLAITTFLLPLCVTGMLCWVAAQHGTMRPRTFEPAAASRVRWRRGGHVALVAGVAVLAFACVLRFVAPFEAITWLTPGDGAGAADGFALAWPLFVLYALASASAMAASLDAVAAVARGRQVSWRFHTSCIAAAIAGGLLATARGADLPGGWPAMFYWWALAGLWSFAVLLALRAGRSGRALVARDWTVYSAALAWLPLSVIPQVPLWELLDVMDLDTAVQTAVTLSFIGHYLVAHLAITHLLDRPREMPGVRGASGSGRLSAGDRDTSRSAHSPVT